MTAPRTVSVGAVSLPGAMEPMFRVYIEAGAGYPPVVAYLTQTEVAALKQALTTALGPNPRKPRARTRAGVVDELALVESSSSTSVVGSLVTKREKALKGLREKNSESLVGGKNMALRVQTIYDWWMAKGGTKPSPWMPLHIARIGLPLDVLIPAMENIWEREHGRIKSLRYFYPALQVVANQTYKQPIVAVKAEPEEGPLRGQSKSMKELVQEYKNARN